MQRLLTGALALGLVAAAAAPSFANCAGHTAENKDKPMTTAGKDNANPPPVTDRQG